MNAFILITFCNTSEIKCSFAFIILTANLNKSKSALFWVKSGYLLKWGTNTLIICSIDVTLIELNPHP